MKKYTFTTLGMLGQMYDEAGEEANFPPDTKFVLASDAEQMETLIKQMGIAHQQYGCGFESEANWLAAYEALLDLVGMNQHWRETEGERLYREYWDPIRARAQAENAQRKKG